ncbi:MAG: hypothetical protein C4325_10810 [Blastocatellia bacterium]
MPFQKMKTSPQGTLLDTARPSVKVETVVLYALGDFQARWLPFDRLRGAFSRASKQLGCEVAPIQDILAELKYIGAEIIDLPDFMAKWPYRIRIPDELARRAAATFAEISNRFQH